MRLRKASPSGQRSRLTSYLIIVNSLLLRLLLFSSLSIQSVSSIETTTTTTSNNAMDSLYHRHQATSAKNSLLESIWKTFRETFENTANALSTSYSNGNALDVEDLYRSRQHHHQQQQQGEEITMFNRRLLLLEQTLSQHYVQSSPQLSAYHSQQQQKAVVAVPSSQTKSSSTTTTNGRNNRKDRTRRPPPIRWKQTNDNFTGETICYCYSESQQSYWSFQWCPRLGIYQGRRLDGDTNGRLMEAQYSLGQWVPTTTTKGHGHEQIIRNLLTLESNNGQNDNEDAQVLLAMAAKSKYPQAAEIEVYLGGDICDAGQKRMSVVIVHESTSSECSNQDDDSNKEEQGSRQQMRIERVDEIRICQYMLHVCRPPPLTPSDHEASLPLENSGTASSITESDAIETNQTLLRIQDVIDSYRRETQADTHRKSTADVLTSLHIGLPPLPQARVKANLKLIKEMFMHAYDSYMYNGYPASEVKPISCKPAVFDLVKIPALTLIDSLDTLVVLGNYSEFARAVERLKHLNDHIAEEIGVFNAGGGLFSLNQNVSVFETNIRILGGLLSAHQLAEAFLDSKVFEHNVWGDDKETILLGTSGEKHGCDEHEHGVESGEHVNGFANDCDSVSMLECVQKEPSHHSTCQNQTFAYWEYDGFLLQLARDIGDRLFPAFNTRTGIPYGTVNLLSGVPKGETTVASLAGGGTLSLEMELLGRLTGNEKYGRAAKLAARALWMRRSQNGLLGKHICTRRGDWTESLSGIGSNSDSFYEYLIKHYILFPEDSDFWLQLFAAYGGVHNESRLGEWYGDVDMSRGMSSGGASRRVFEALMAFYPGMQVLLGEVTPAARTLNSFFLVREYLGFLPERFNYANWRVDTNGGNHLLRPELVESAYFLHRSSKGFQQHFRPNPNMSLVDSSGWQWAGDFALHAIQKLTRTNCGYASLRDISSGATGALNAEQNHAKLMNEMPSYFLSETLKYMYLLFDENNLLHVDEDRDWVFTTEAHPIHYEEKLTTHRQSATLGKQKMLLKQRIQRRLEKKQFPEEAPWESLGNEKWTDESDMEVFLEQLEPLAVEGREAYEARRTVFRDQLYEHGYFPHVVEPYLSHDLSSGDLDSFNERFLMLNPTHLAFRKLGNGVTLTQACPNLYVTNLLWIRALNGGAADYADTYMSRLQDDVLVSTSRSAVLGSVDALSLHGTGIHVESIYDEFSKCPIGDARNLEYKPHAISDAKKSSQQQSEHGLARIDMGNGMGSFEVSAFPGGSGFFMQHVESGETLVTTLLEGEGNGQGSETYILVYSNPGSDSLEHRSVVMADLNGNSYSCMVQIVAAEMQSQQAAAEEDTCLRDTNEDFVGNEDVKGSQQEVLAQFPCAPALFGPSNILNLNQVGTITVEAAILAPSIGEEYGCSASIKKQSNSFSDKIHPVKSEFADGDSVSGGEEPPDFVCGIEVVSLIHRGICTFQEKSRNQKNKANAIGVVVINSEEDELFVMSGGGSEDENTGSQGMDGFPVTVLVTGSDGRAIMEIIDLFENTEHSQVNARISLVRDQAQISEPNQSVSLTGNTIWPAVRANHEALQIYSHSGWGVHALQRPGKDNGDQLEWQLFLTKLDILQP